MSQAASDSKELLEECILSRLDIIERAEHTGFYDEYPAARDSDQRMLKKLEEIYEKKFLSVNC